MNLEKRTNQIFNELLNNRQIRSKDLCEKFDLSRGQLNYAIKKINESLKIEKLGEISRTKQGYFTVSNETIAAFKKNEGDVLGEISEYVFSGTERIYLIVLLLLSKEEYLSLNHFIEELAISRNTALRDLKAVDEELYTYELSMKYTRKDGYFIDGDEWNKRWLLSDILNHLYTYQNGQHFIARFAHIGQEEIRKYHERIEIIEEELNIQFTDERIKVLPALIILLIRRAKKGRLISYNFKINYRELADTKEYFAAEKVVWDIDDISENERVYLTLLILTANLSKADVLSVNEFDKLKVALQEVMDLFEKIAGVGLSDKAKLLDRLLVHMRPAYYRIKYNLNLQTKYFQENKDENLFSIFYLVKEASQPLNDFFQQEVPDAELFFISLFIGSHLADTLEIQTSDTRKKAFIVCPNGVSIAVLLENTLRNLLPEIHFIRSMSVREFYQTNQSVDFVFSAVPLKTKNKLFIVDTFLTPKEKRQLRDRVLRSASILQTGAITPEKILEIVNKHTVVKDEAGLYDEVLALFDTEETKILEKKKPHLLDLLKDETIQLFNGPITWSEVLGKLADPLMKQGKITENYVVELKKEMPVIPSYSVLQQKIALPHTVPEAGALGVGVSLGIVKEGLFTEEGQKIHTVILLCSNDKEEHLDLIFEMMNLSGSSDLVSMEKAETTREIRKQLEDFSEDYWRVKE